MWFYVYEISRIDKPIELECRLGVARGWGGDNGMGFYFHHGVIGMFWGEMEVVVAHFEDVKCHWTVHCKMVNFMLCEFHLNKLFLK